MKILTVIALLGATLLPLQPGAAKAQEFTFGLNVENGRRTTALDIEYALPPLSSGRMVDFGWLGAARFAEDGAAYIGGGLGGNLNFTPSVFATANLTAGLYHDGAVNMGGAVMFRAVYGVGFRLNDSTALSIAGTQLTNAGLYSTNPRAKGISLRLQKRF